MNFVCDRCQTRYSIADEKVRSKILRIRCKTCGSVIVVEGEHALSSGGETAAPEHKSTVSAKVAPSSGPKAAPSSAFRSAPSSAPKAAPSSGPKAAPSSGPKAAPSAGAKVGGGGSPPPPPPPIADPPDPLGGRVEWYVAICGVRSGPFSRVQAARLIIGADPSKTAHVWKEGMSGWKASDDVSVIARELNILRPLPPPTPPRQPVKTSALPPPPPPPPPPPTPRQPVKVRALSPPPPTASTGVAAASAPSVKPAVASKNLPHAVFPGKSLAPAPASISDASDFAEEAHANSIAEITTKGAIEFAELETGPTGGFFTEATTKKSKSLRDLEAETPFPTSPDFSEMEVTPPPVYPLLPVAVKAVEVMPASAMVRGLPVAAGVGSPNTPGIAGIATSSPVPLAAGSLAGQYELSGFAKVRQAVAAGDHASSSPQPFPALMEVPIPATFPAQISSDFRISKGIWLSDLFRRQPGLKYAIAVCVLVALVILLVVLGLRGDGNKRAESAITPAITPANEPATVETPKPAALEPQQLKPATEEKSAQVTRVAGGKHRSGRPIRRVDIGPSPERYSTQKQTVRTGYGSPPALPNPFNQAEAVSQQQISAVVRNKANQAGLKSCYERALKMDNNLTSGRVDVTVSVRTSGTVERVVVNAPASFILVEPCIKNAVKRWVFPPSSEEYATNFPLIMQGGM